MKSACIVLGLVYLAVAGTAASSAENAAAGDEKAAAVSKVGVQTAVLDFISGKACEVHGVCKFGTIRARYSRLLDGVEKKDGRYVARAEFVAGKDVFTMEYDVEQRDGSYAVVREVILKRNGKPVNEVLWEEESGRMR